METAQHLPTKEKSTTASRSQWLMLWQAKISCRSLQCIKYRGTYRGAKKPHIYPPRHFPCHCPPRSPVQLCPSQGLTQPQITPGNKTNPTRRNPTWNSTKRNPKLNPTRRNPTPNSTRRNPKPNTTRRNSKLNPMKRNSKPNAMRRNPKQTQ